MTERRDDGNVADTGGVGGRARKPLAPAARRALAEAEERRRRTQAETGESPIEKGGRKGPEPTRYGDWEKDGIISDF